eukprot:15457538-Alexandrium_andersonii.AAC.1
MHSARCQRYFGAVPVRGFARTDRCTCLEMAPFAQAAQRCSFAWSQQAWWPGAQPRAKRGR